MDLFLESGLTKGELETYDRYWDYISTAFGTGYRKVVKDESRKSIRAVAGNQRRLKQIGMEASIHK